MVSLTINGKNVEVEPETTILQAAKSLGYFIPTLCYDPQLSITGTCGICVVQVDKADDLVVSCETPVSEGMVVNTDTERVHKARKEVLTNIREGHPLDCFTCEKNSDCRLQDYCYLYGVFQLDYTGYQKKYEIEDTNPFFIRNMDRCIRCGLCVRICHEVNGAGAFNLANEDYDPGTVVFTEPSCVFCGMCVDICPAGALIAKQKMGTGRVWDATLIKTVCPYCGIGCGLEMHVKDNTVVNVRGDLTSPVSRGQTCVKGRFGFDFLNSPERLTTPLIRKNGELVKATWNEAIGLIAEKLKGLEGAELAGLASARATNEDNYLFQKLIRSLGSNNIDHCARLWHAPTVAGLATSFGSGAMTNSIGEIEDAKAMFVIGSNTTETHPVLAYRMNMAKNKGAVLIVADPRQIELSNRADVFLQLRPGTNAALINGIINVIIEKGLADEQFIQERTEGFEEMAQVVKKYTPEYVEEITGVAAENIREAAQLFAGADSAAIYYTMGVTQHTDGTNSVSAIANLAMVTGNVGKPFSGVNPLRGQNNVQGACDMGGLPGVFTGYQSVADETARTKFEKAWGVALNSQPGLTITEIFDSIHDGEIKALYVMGENPVLSDANIRHVEAALDKIEFLVVQDIFLSETAARADVVLPAAAFAEKSGTFTNTERRVQLVRQAVKAPGEAKADWVILQKLAQKIGLNWHYEDSADIFREIAQLTPSYTGINYERMEQEGGLQWPCPSPDHPGTSYLHKGGFARGKGLFVPVEHQPSAEEPDQDYPLVLTTGRNRYHYHTGSMTRESKPLSAFKDEEWVQISKADAVKLDIESGDLVMVSSRRGQVKVRADVTEVVPSGVIFMTFHYREAPANILTNDKLDPIAKTPELKVCAVKVEKIA